MALVYADRVVETSTTTGTGTYTLAGAVTGYQSFAAVGNGNTAYYCAIDVDGSGGPLGGWEVGLGTYTAAGTLLARTTVLASSNGGAAVNWAAGTRRIFVDLPADQLAQTGTGNLVRATSPTLVTPVLGTPASGDATNLTNIPVNQAKSGSVLPGLNGGGLVLLEQHSASASASLNFTTCISATYDEYVIEVVSLILNTNTAALQIQISTDGGGTYVSTGYVSMVAGWRLASAVSGSGTSTTGILLINTYGTGVTRGSVCGFVRLFNPADAVNDKLFTGEILGPISDGFMYKLEVGGELDSASAYTAFRVIPSSGTITSGTIRCYGIAK